MYEPEREVLGRPGSAGIRVRAAPPPYDRAGRPNVSRTESATRPHSETRAKAAKATKDSCVCATSSARTEPEDDPCDRQGSSGGRPEREPDEERGSEDHDSERHAARVGPRRTDRTPPELRHPRRSRPRTRVPINLWMSRSAQRMLLAARIALAAGVAVYAVRTLVHLPARRQFLDNWFYDGLLFWRALVCGLRAASGSRSRSGWVALGAGIAAWAAGDSYYTHWIGNDPNPPFPSLADVGYLGFFPLRLRRASSCSSGPASPS